ncbi:hypothetical protein RRSWK_02753 [Rhodopirellula sp. SWK7]|nr:hypothetical protein RRSWK_02753 [Rhodopirellula sp. SWK7]
MRLKIEQDAKGEFAAEDRTNAASRVHRSISVASDRSIAHVLFENTISI